MTPAGRLRHLAAASDSWVVSSREVEPATPSVLRKYGEEPSHASSALVSLQATDALINRLSCPDNTILIGWESTSQAARRLTPPSAWPPELCRFANQRRSDPATIRRLGLPCAPSAPRSLRPAPWHTSSSAATLDVHGIATHPTLALWGEGLMPVTIARKAVEDRP